MSDKNFTLTFSVDQTPDEAFEAIRNVRGWWSGKLEGHSHEAGDEFTYRHEDLHASTQRVTEVIPGKKVSWLVLEAQLEFTRNKSEWKGTQICFELGTRGKKTEVRFTHLGLVPTFECFEACSGGWNFYIKDSLRSLIETGKGKPD